MSLVTFLKFIVEQGFKVDLYLAQQTGPLLGKVPSGVEIVPPFSQEWRKATARSRPLRQVLTSKPFPSPKELANYASFRILRASRNPWKLAKSEREYDLAISYCHYGFAPRFVIDGVEASRKIMWWHHGSYSATGKKRRSDRYYFSRMDGIGAVSASARSLIQEEFPELLSRTSLVPNMVDPCRTRALGGEAASPEFPSEALKIVTVGRLSHEKGIDLALDAASILVQQQLNFAWFIIGDGEQAALLRSKAQDLGVGDHVRFIGSRMNPFPHVARSDLYVQPSRVEAHPIGILEAISLRVPVIATNIPANREVLSDGKWGLLTGLPPEEIAQGILELAGDENRRDLLRRSYLEFPGVEQAESAITSFLGLSK